MDKLLQGLPPWVLLLASGSVIAYWQQFKNFFSGFIHLFLAEAQLDDIAIGAFVRHMERNSWRAPASTTVYSTWFPFVRPKRRTQHVLLRWLGGAPINYWYHWYCPVFVSGFPERDNNKTSPSSDRVRVRFLRGTLDIDAIIASEFDRMGDEVQKEISEEQQRFSVIHVFGHAMSMDSSSGAPARGGRGINDWDDDDNNHHGSIISVNTKNINLAVGWEFEQLGPDRESASLDSLALSATLKALVAEIGLWLTKKDWYKERGIPWKRGYLLAGPPGVGKSCLVRAIAEHFDLPIYVFDLSSLSNE